MSSRPSFPTVYSTRDGGTRDVGDTFDGEPRLQVLVLRFSAAPKGPKQKAQAGGTPLAGSALGI
jgi:hypothetical protein